MRLTKNRLEQSILQIFLDITYRSQLEMQKVEAEVAIPPIFTLFKTESYEERRRRCEVPQHAKKEESRHSLYIAGGWYTLETER